MRSLTISDDTVMLNNGSPAERDNTSIYAVGGTCVVGWISDPALPSTTFTAFEDGAVGVAGGNFAHGHGCYLAVQVTGTSVVNY